MSFLLYPFISFLLVVLIIPYLREKALRLGYVDKPSGRKNHADLVPPIGGLVIFTVFLIVSILSGTDFSYFWPLYAGILILLLTGAVDDVLEVTPWVKFLLQSIAALVVVVFGDVVVFDMGDLFGFGNVELGWFGYVFSWFCVVLLINSINMMDGLDGLAGGKSAIVLLWFVAACFGADLVGATNEILIILGALFGFLVYNMRHPMQGKASVFLGDAGSMCLGLVLGWYAIGLTQGDEPVLIPVSVAWIVALPVIDAFALFVYRAKNGRHPFSADRKHFHHHFVHAAIPVSWATLYVLLIGSIWGAIGYFGIELGLSEPFMMYAWVGVLVVHTAITFYPEKFIRFLSKFGVHNV